MGDLALFNNNGIDDLFNKKIVLYGASSSGQRMANILKGIDVKPYAFCDSNSLKWNKEFLGLPILSSEELFCEFEKEPNAYRIIICSVYLKEIYQQICHKIEEKNIYSSYAVELAMKFYSYTKDNKCLDWYKEKVKLMNKIWEIPERWNSFEFNNSLERRRILQLLDTEKEIVLVFSHRKVGSKTIYNSIGKNFFTLHFHDMKICLENNDFFNIEFWYEILNNLKKRNKKIKIISGVREPISRDISGFFQVLLAYNNVGIVNFQYSFIENVKNYIMQEITKKNNISPKSCREYCQKELKYGSNFDWFNIELKKYFNIDIYNSDFDRDKGYKVYKNDNIEVFVYKMEKLSQLDTALGKFIGDGNFQLLNSNMSDKKPYWILYKELKESIVLPRKYVDFYYKDNPCMDYFYTKEEQSDFLLKWKIE